MSDSSAQLPAWHAALAFALTGEEFADLGRQRVPDCARLVEELSQRRPGGVEALRDGIRQRLEAGQPPLRPVPPELGAGIGAAQLAAAGRQLVEMLQVSPQPRVQAAGASRMTADDRRLLDEVPPHHLG
ncbi:MAG: hypothetical protein ACLGIF_05260 [Actinomycetes bacterium]